LGISQNTQAKKAGLNLDGIHLDFTCDWDTEKWVFMIWEGMIKFETVKKIIEEIKTFMKI
jgi:hypothetical protein